MIKAHRTYLLKVDLPSLKVLACSNHWHHTIVITSKLEMAKGLDGTWWNIIESQFIKELEGKSVRSWSPLQGRADVNFFPFVGTGNHSKIEKNEKRNWEKIPPNPRNFRRRIFVGSVIQEDWWQLIPTCWVLQAYLLGLTITDSLFLQSQGGLSVLTVTDAS